jgi:hypothetical protein
MDNNKIYVIYLKVNSLGIEGKNSPCAIFHRKDMAEGYVNISSDKLFEIKELENNIFKELFDLE